MKYDGRTTVQLNVESQIIEAIYTTSKTYKCKADQKAASSTYSSAIMLIATGDLQSPSGMEAWTLRGHCLKRVLLFLEERAAP